MGLAAVDIIVEKGSIVQDIVRSAVLFVNIN